MQSTTRYLHSSRAAVVVAACALAAACEPTAVPLSPSGAVAPASKEVPASRAIGAPASLQAAAATTRTFSESASKSVLVVLDVCGVVLSQMDKVRGQALMEQALCPKGFCRIGSIQGVADITHPLPALHDPGANTTDTADKAWKQDEIQYSALGCTTPIQDLITKWFDDERLRDSGTLVVYFDGMVDDPTQTNAVLSDTDRKRVAGVWAIAGLMVNQPTIAYVLARTPEDVATARRAATALGSWGGGPNKIPWATWVRPEPLELYPGNPSGNITTEPIDDLNAQSSKWGTAKPRLEVRDGWGAGAAIAGTKGPVTGLPVIVAGIENSRAEITHPVFPWLSQPGKTPPWKQRGFKVTWTHATAATWAAGLAGSEFALEIEEAWHPANTNADEITLRADWKKKFAGETTRSGFAQAVWYSSVALDRNSSTPESLSLVWNVGTTLLCDANALAQDATRACQQSTSWQSKGAGASGVDSLEVPREKSTPVAGRQARAVRLRWTGGTKCDGEGIAFSAGPKDLLTQVEKAKATCDSPLNRYFAETPIGMFNTFRNTMHPLTNSAPRSKSFALAGLQRLGVALAERAKQDVKVVELGLDPAPPPSR